jgi:hypothetical protein
MIVSQADHKITSTALLWVILCPRYRGYHANGMAGIRA